MTSRSVSSVVVALPSAPSIPRTGTTPMNAAIATSELVKTFGRTRALDRLDLTVEPGEVHGFLGPNGAGKSTTIRILLGLLRADGGRVEVLGRDPWRDSVALHRRMAYVPGDVELWPNLTGGEAIDLFGRLRGGLDPIRRDELIERFDLDPTKKGRTYSKGNRQKVAIVAALASDVELLLLDEPTAGLDPLLEVEFQACIREAQREGRTVLLSSHVLAQVEALCDHVSIIRRGRIVESGELAKMQHLSRQIMSVETAQVPQELDTMPGVHALRRDGRQATFELDPEHLDAVIGYLHRSGLRALASQPPSLEQLFLRHYGDPLDSRQAS